MQVSRTPLSYASTVRSNASGRSVTLTGTDRVQNVPMVKDHPDGSFLCIVRIEPAAFNRLSGPARAFQKITWNSLRFNIAPRVSTSSSGGYVAGFVADAGDALPEGEGGKQILTAQLGTVSSPIFKPSSFHVRLQRKAYYTSFAENPRFSSPGTFYIMVDGQANQEGGLVVTCDWSATLTVPGDNAEMELVPTLVFTHPAYIKEKDAGYHLWGDGLTSANAYAFSNLEEVLAKSPNAKVFKARYPITLSTSNSDSSLVQSYVMRYLIYKKDGGTPELQASETPDGRVPSHVMDGTCQICAPGDNWDPYEVNPELGFWRSMGPYAHSRSGAELFCRPKRIGL